MFKYKIVIFFAVIGFAASIAAFFIIDHSEEKRIATAFEKAATERIDLITYAFGITQLVTESSTNLFLASEVVSREEFNNFVSSYLNKLEGIKSVSWIPRIDQNNKDEFIASFQDIGQASLTLFEKDKNGNRIPLKTRSTYFPIIYAVPYDQNADDIGYDLGSDKTMSNALLRASLTGKTVSTSRIECQGKDETSYCISIFDPVFKLPGKDLPGIVESKELIGFTSCELSIKDIVESSFEIVNTNGIDILLYDESSAPKRELLYSSIKGSLDNYDPENIDPDYLFNKYKFTVGGRDWSINTYATDEFISENKSLLPFLAMMSGLILTGMFVTYNLRIFRERDEISNKVKTRTAELKESNQRLDLALSAANLVVWDWNIKSGEVYLSEKMLNILGYESDEIISEADVWRGLIHPDDSEMVNSILDKHFNNETPIYSVEYRVRTKSGNYKWMLDVGKVFKRDEQSNPLRAIGIHMDISDRKTIQEKILEYNRMLEKDNSDMNRLFSIIGHDLKSPLISIKGFSEFLYNEIKDLSQEEVVEYSKYIFQASNSLHSMLEGLLDWGQMQMGKIVFNPEQTNLYQLSDKVMNQFLIMALPKKIKIENNINTGLNVFVDRSMISTVLRNLLSNAIKFTPAEGKVTIDAEYSDRDEIVISVTDTGVGIEPEKLGHILSDSFNKSTLGTDGEKGTGLGLSLSKDFVERNGGRMWVESELGNGTTFYFSIPLKEETAST